MKSINLWTNFCPTKLYWELKQLPEFFSLSGSWWESAQIIDKQLRLLKKAGITGLRLNIFSSEITSDAQTLHWQPIEVMLELAQKNALDVQLCLGPYQYPLWPGIRLPDVFLHDKQVNQVIDSNKKWQSFGKEFLETQLKRYGKDQRISGFYLGNEWHTAQAIENFPKKKQQFRVSAKQMETLTRVCKKCTKKNIIFNTNFQPFQTKKIEYTFLSLFKILKNQASIGFDIYPSQETFSKAPRLFLHRKLHSFSKDIELLKKQFSQRLTISEFEAQPWGNGKSWYEQLKIHTHTVPNFAKILIDTFERYISPSQFDQVTLWGAEYWLVAYHMGQPQMLDTVEQLKKKYSNQKKR